MRRRHYLGFAGTTLLLLGALLGGALLGVLFVFLGGGTARPIAITLGGPHGTPTTTATVPQAALAQAKDSDVAHHNGLASENPAGVSAQQLDASRQQQEKLAVASGLPNVTPDAAPQQRGCVTRLVRNYSSRRGVPPREEVAHYTVSPNRPGWSDVYAVAGLFDRAAFAASSNYIIDAEGHCLYIVRESDKAWTQAAANPFSISIEGIGMGNEPGGWLGGPRSPGFAKAALVFHDAGVRWRIPAQRGLVIGCLVVRPGIVDHNSLGACGGGHHDITPYSVDDFVRAVQALGGGSGKPAKRTVARCSVRNLQRRLRLTADGIVGPKTRAAIAALQRRHGWRVTAHAGPRVGKALSLRGCAI